VTAREEKTVTRRGSKHPALVIVHGSKDGVKFSVERVAGKSLKFTVNDEKVEMGTIPLNQKRIEEFLGINPVLFLGCTLFGHNSFRLTRAGDSARKELLEELIDLERFHTARERVGAERTKAIGDDRSINSEISVLCEKQDEFKETLEANTRSNTAELEKAIKEQKDRLRLLEAKLPADNMNTPRPVATVEAELSVQKRNREIAEDALAKIGKMDTCPTCKQKVTNRHKADMREASEELLRGIDRARQELSKELIEARKYWALMDEINICSRYIEDAQAKLNSVAEGKTDLQKHLKEQIQTIGGQITRLQAQSRALMKKLAVYDFWWKAFQRSGVMSLLMDSVIEQLNAYALEASVGLTDGLLAVQMSSTTTSKSGNVQDKISLEVLNGGEIAPYTSLSNSEQQRIDMIMMFAWQRLMQDYAGVAVDVAFFDEIFEGLDADSMERVLSYIVSVRGKLPTYIISHVPDTAFAPSSVLRVIRDKDGSHVEATL